MSVEECDGVSVNIRTNCILKYVLYTLILVHMYCGPCTQGGLTALMKAVQKNQHRAAKLLIMDLKCDKDLKDEVCVLDGWTMYM